MRPDLDPTALAASALAAVAILAAPAAGPAAAQSLADYDYEHLTFRAVGLGGGYLWSAGIKDTELYTLRLDLGYLGPGVRIVPSIAYWRSEVAATELDALATRLNQVAGSLLIGADLAPIEWSDVSLSVDGQFVWSTPIGVLTFVGVGAGLHALNGSGPAVDDTFIEDLLDDFTAGVNALAGLELEPINRVRIYAEGRYTAMSSLQYASARAGIQIMFNRGGVEVGAAPAPPASAARAADGEAEGRGAP